LLPGLIDMHVHLDPSASDPQGERPLALYAAHGVTTVRVMWGRDGHLALRAAIRAENRFAPSLVLAGPGFGSSKYTPAEVKAIVEQQAKEGWDLVKVHWNPTPAQFDAVIAAAKAAGISVAGHVPYAVSLDHVLASGQRSIEHMDGYLRDLKAEGGSLSDAALQDAVARTKAAGVAVVPTLFGWRVHLHDTSTDELKALPSLAYVPPQQVDSWLAKYEPSFKEWAKGWAKYVLGMHDVSAIVANRVRLLQAFSRGGVPVLMGTDAGQPFVIPGASAVAELQAMHDAGLSNRQVIESATVVAGRFLDPNGHLGVIVPGARADLVLLASNPLEDLKAFAHPGGVMLRGQWYDGAEMAATLARVAAEAKQSPPRN
jgi:imidazolonepropionase-like amidohydrolase